MTEFTDESDRSVLDLGRLAAERALADAEREPSDLTSFHVGNALSGELNAQAGIANALVSRLGIEGVRADRVENTSASGASAFHRGVEAVRGGADTALVVGVEKMSGGETASVTESISRLVHDREYVQGLTLPSFAGIAAAAYLDRYDAPRAALAAVAAKNHRNAIHNRFAQFRKSVTIDEVLASPTVAAPLRLFDCCSITDGAAAVVLSRDGGIRVDGVAGATGTHAVAARPDPLAIESVQTAGERAFARATVDRDDIDVACIHDAFTILELLELEELGFYDPGTAWRATQHGKTAVNGALPVNPGGGLKARGHPLGATGVAQVIELVWQLRGEAAAPRQVPEGPETGLAVNVAGFGNNSVCTVLRR